MTYTQFSKQKHGIGVWRKFLKRNHIKLVIKCEKNRYRLSFDCVILIYANMKNFTSFWLFCCFLWNTSLNLLEIVILRLCSFSYILNLSFHGLFTTTLQSVLETRTRLIRTEVNTLLITERERLFYLILNLFYHNIYKNTTGKCFD